MTYRTLLAVHIAHDPVESLASVTGMARALDAHLVVAVVNEAAVLPTTLLGNDSPRVTGDAFFRLIEATDRRVEAVADYLRDRRVGGTALPACQQLGLIADTIAQAAVYADLVWMNAAQSVLAGVDAAAFEGALLRAGRPVLLAPRSDAPLPLEPRKAWVAWDASPQAARAVTSSLPLLERAGRVHIAMLEDSDRLYRSRAGLVTDWMRRHGIDVVVHRILRDGALVQHALHAFMVDAAPDLLVMGAYGQGRLRERVLGGATHSMLSALPCPTLLAR